MSFEDDPWRDPRDPLPGGFVPPEAVAAVARRGLALRAAHGRGGTEVGLARGRGLAARQALGPAEMRVIAAWFARHGAMRRGAGWGDDAAPSTGWIAWLLWGGDACRAWVEAERPRWERPRR